MAQKRTSESLIPYNDPKRSKNDLVAYTNKDKALIQSVR